MSKVMATWRDAIEGARVWGRDAAADFRGVVREISGRTAAEPQPEQDPWRWPPPIEQGQEPPGPAWLAREADGRILEVDADGYPGREADPGDGRPVAEAGDQADADYHRWAQEGERGNPPASAPLDPSD